MSDMVTNSYFDVIFTGGIPLLGLKGHFTSVSGLNIGFDYETYNEGGSNYPRQFFKNVVPQTLVLEHGTVTSIDRLSAWIAAINSGSITTLNGLVTLTDRNGGSLRVWSVIGAFPVLYSGPTLNGMRPEVAVTKIELRHNGCF